MAPRTVAETYTHRRSIETTFQEMRAYLGLETTRGRTEKTVLRAAPCLFGLFSVIVLLYAGAGQPGTRRSDPVARQDRPDLLGCDHRRAALALDRLGLCKTVPTYKGRAAIRLRSRGVAAGKNKK